MLTVQRLNVDRPHEVLTDTVVFYGSDGEAVASFDTSDRTADMMGNPSESVCRGTGSQAVEVYGKNSGFSAKAGYTVPDNSIPYKQTSASLCIRHMKNALDNKIYFDIGKGTAPKRGEIWKSDIYYEISYTKK